MAVASAGAVAEAEALAEATVRAVVAHALEGLDVCTEPSILTAEILGLDIGSSQAVVEGEDRQSTLAVQLRGGDNVLLTLVADGHGGAEVADLASRRVLTLIADLAADGSASSIKVACEAAFARAQEESLALGKDAGCTLTVVVVNKDRRELSCANLGDSLALFFHEEGHLWLSTDHRIEKNSDERDRILRLGGQIGYMNVPGSFGTAGSLRCWPGGIAVARGLGDSDCRTKQGVPLVSPMPSFYTVDMPASGGLVLLGSDGVWDALSEKEVVKLIRSGKFGNADEAAASVIMRVGKPIDDTTATVLLFAPPSRGGGREMDGGFDEMDGSCQRPGWLSESSRTTSEVLSNAFNHKRKGRTMAVRRLSDPLITDELNKLLDERKNALERVALGAQKEASGRDTPPPSMEAMMTRTLTHSPSNAPNAKSRNSNDGFSVDAKPPSAETPDKFNDRESLVGSELSVFQHIRLVKWGDLPQLKLLGEGEFAQTYASTLLGNPVAVKLIRPEKRGSEAAVRGLKREIMLQSLMSHPGVISTVGLGQHESHPFMVMLKLATTLDAVLPSPKDAVPIWVRRREIKRWPLSRGVNYGIQLASALAYCHDEAFPGYKVMHRDIKPRNIGLTQAGKVVLFDFGLASIWHVDVNSESTETRSLTGETGSLRYMSPEMANSEPYNHKSDVFSLTSVLYEMCAHEKPFSNVGVDQFKNAIARGVRPVVASKWPVELKQIFNDGWQASPSDRPEARDITPRLAAIVPSLEEPGSVSSDDITVNSMNSSGGCCNLQ